MTATTNIQVTRPQAEALVAAVLFRADTLEMLGKLVGDDDTRAELAKLATVRTMLDAARDRIGWLEQNQWHSDIRDRLAANTSYPDVAA